MKKIILIVCTLLCIIVAAVVLSLNKKLYLSDCIITDDIGSIEISLFGNNEDKIIIDNHFEINNIIKKYSEITLHKRNGEPKTGFSYEMAIYHRDNTKDIIIVSKEITINDTVYTCDDNFYDITDEVFKNHKNDQ